MNDDEIKRHFDIVIEKVSDHIQLIAEGHVMLAQRFDRVDARLDTMDGRLTRVEAGVATLQEEVRTVKEEVRIVKEEARTFKADVAREFGEVKAMIKLSYAELDGRLRSLEHDVGDLRIRLERLEARVPAGAVS